MASVLGKRKKSSSATASSKAGSAVPAPAADNSSSHDDASAAIQAIFQRHFEAQFQPLTAGKTKEKKKKQSEAAREAAASKKSRRGSSSAAEDDDDDSDASDGSSWSGLTDEEGDTLPAVEVVDYSTPLPGAVGRTPDDATAGLSKRERKLYLSSRPPNAFDNDDDDAAAKKRKQRRGKKAGASDDMDAAADGDADPAAGPTYKDAPDLLANDLALQRLISESHLLAGAFRLPSSVSTSAGAVAGVAGSAGAGANNSKTPAAAPAARPFAAGRLRQRTTDLRIQAVAHKGRGAAGAFAGATAGGASGSGSAPGSAPQLPLLLPTQHAKDSIFTQAKMPMAQRKGMTAMAAAREAKRRQEARESGIVLERPAKKTPAKPAKGDRRLLRAVDAPAIGRLRGSELKLRDRDIRAIEGPRKTTGSNKKRR